MKTIFLLLLFVPNAWAQIGAKTQQSTLVGTWQNNDFGYAMTLLLQPNKTGEFDGEQIHYTTTSSLLSITQGGVTTNYAYVLKGSNLTLSGGDLEGQITFSRVGSTQSNEKIVQSPATPTPGNIIGVWSGYGETVEFKADGICVYARQNFPYTLTADNVQLQTTQGIVLMEYKLSGDKLSLTANGQTVVYARGGFAETGNAPTAIERGRELEGKWCYVNVSSSYSGGSSAEQCITLHANGTYEYYQESSRSVNGGTFFGGTNSQGSDRGTWRYDGQRVYYQSQTGKGDGSYLLEKRNHPKTNDPMIVLDGTSYVTQYQKNPWN